MEKSIIRVIHQVDFRFLISSKITKCNFTLITSIISFLVSSGTPAERAGNAVATIGLLFFLMMMHN